MAFFFLKAGLRYPCDSLLLHSTLLYPTLPLFQSPNPFCSMVGFLILSCDLCDTRYFGHRRNRQPLAAAFENFTVYKSCIKFHPPLIPATNLWRGNSKLSNVIKSARLLPPAQILRSHMPRENILQLDWITLNEKDLPNDRKRGLVGVELTNQDRSSESHTLCVKSLLHIKIA